RGLALASDAESHGAPGGAAHAHSGLLEIAADIDAVDLHDLIAAPEPRELRGRALDGMQHLHRPVCGPHLHAAGGIGAHGADANRVELLAVEIGGMRIEGGHHAAQRLLHQYVIVDVLDVVALDALIDFSEEARLLPAEDRAIGRGRGARLMRPLGEHAPAERAAAADDAAREERGPRARVTRETHQGVAPAYHMTSAGARSLSPASVGSGNSFRSSASGIGLPIAKPWP